MKYTKRHISSAGGLLRENRMKPHIAEVILTHLLVTHHFSPLKTEFNNVLRSNDPPQCHLSGLIYFSTPHLAL